MSLPEPSSESEPEVPSTPVLPSLPSPVLIGPADPDVAPRYTVRDWLMFALGTLLSLASIVTGGLGSVALIVIFFVNRSPRVPFLRGIGLGLAILGVLLLGALTLCFVALGAGGGANSFVH